MKVFIGVGHGGIDSGTVYNNLVEKKINLNISLAIEKYLKERNIDVKLSRYKDESDTLNSEIKECNDYKPDCAVEIHCNAGNGIGHEIFVQYYPVNDKNQPVHKFHNKSLKLAQYIDDSLIEMGHISRGIKSRLSESNKTYDYYGWLRYTKCPAVLVECAFLDNIKDSQTIDTEEEQIQFGIHIAKAIEQYLGMV